MKTQPYNIVIYPPKEIRQAAVSISDKSQGVFILDDVNFFPHVSLYMTEFPNKNLKKISNEIQRIANTTKEFLIKADNSRIVDGGYFDIAYYRSKEILDLQESLVRSLNPLREGAIREKEKKNLNSFNSNETKNIINYGYRWVGENYVPHLTFTRFNALPKKLKFDNNFSFKVSKLGFFALGDNGTCIKKIKVFKLKD